MKDKHPLEEWKQELTLIKSIASGAALGSRSAIRVCGNCHKKFEEQSQYLRTINYNKQHIFSLRTLTSVWLILIIRDILFASGNVVQSGLPRTQQILYNWSISLLIKKSLYQISLNGLFLSVYTDLTIQAKMQY